jgi:hypothetical protein
MALAILSYNIRAFEQDPEREAEKACSGATRRIVEYS